VLELLTILAIVATLVLNELNTGLVNVIVPVGWTVGTALNVIVVCAPLTEVASTVCPPTKPVPVTTCPTLIATTPVVTVRLVLDVVPLKNVAVAVLLPLRVELMY
jgi:hypothetical protein